MSVEFSIFQNMLDNNHRNDGVFARFYDKTIKTSEINENGLPVFKKITYIEIRTRDNPDIFDQPANETHKNRFPVELARYQLALKEEEKGTPLSQFAFLSAEQLEACKYRGIFTVERLAELEESKVVQLGLQDEQILAKKFLEVNTNNKALSDFAAKERKYKAQIKKLEEEIKELKAGKNE